MAITDVGPPATREAILEAAEQVFGRLGYGATTVSGVAQAAGVSRPLVYRYFSDKETLYRLVVERVLVQWNEALVEVADQVAPTTAHTLRSLIAACLEWGRTRPILQGVLLRDAGLTRRVAGDVVREGRDRLPALLERVLTTGRERGDVRADLPAAEVATVISEVMVAGSLRALSGGHEADHSRHMETMIEVVLHGVVVRGPA